MTGIPVLNEVIAAAAPAAGKRPSVRVTVGGHFYRTTAAAMVSRFLVPLNAENRADAHTHSSGHGYLNQRSTTTMTPRS